MFFKNIYLSFHRIQFTVAFLRHATNKLQFKVRSICTNLFNYIICIEIEKIKF